MDKTRQERYNMIYGNTARKIEDLAAEPVRRQPRKTRKARPRRETSGKGVNKTESEESDVDRSGLYQGISCGTLCDRSCKFLLSVRTHEVLNQKAALTDAKTQLNTLQVENEDLNLEIEQSILF